MKSGKDVGPPVEVWRCSGERAVNFLTIFLTRPRRVRGMEMCTDTDFKEQG